MKGFWKWTRRIATALGLAALVVLGLWIWLLPSIIERAAAAQLEAAGLPQPSLRVGGHSLRRLELVNLAAGNGDRLRVGAIGVDYNVSQLMRKRIDTVEIIGLEAEVRRRNGVWDLGPLANLHGSATGEMPFKRITLRAATLLIDIDGRRLLIPCHGSVENKGQNVLAIDLAASVEGAMFQVAGTFNVKSQEFALTLVGETPELATVLAAVAPRSPAKPAGLLGRLAVKATLERDQSAMRFDATAEGAGWKLTQVTARETGLADWLDGKTDRAQVVVHCQAAADKPWLLLKATPLQQWINGEALAKAELSADATLELRRAATGTAPSRATAEAGPGRTAAAPAWTWSIDVASAHATLAPSDLVVPKAGAALEGLRADLRLSATVNEGRLRLALLPGSLVAAVGGSVRRGDIGDITTKGQQSGLDLVVGEKPIVATVALGNGGADWQVEAPEVRLALRRGRAELRGGFVAEGVAGNLAFRADADQKRATASLLPGSWLAVESAEGQAGGEVVRLGAAKFTCTQQENQPLFTFRFASAGRTTAELPDGRPFSGSAALVAESAAPVTVAVGPGATAKLGTIRSTVEAAWGEQGGSFAGSLGINGIGVTLNRKFGDRTIAANVPAASLLVKARRDFKSGSGPQSPLVILFTAGTTPGVAGGQGDPNGPGLTASLAGIDVVAQGLVARGTVSLADTGPAVVEARVLLTDASVRNQAAGLAVTGLTAELPLTWNLAAPAAAGRFAAKSIELQGQVLPAISGTLGLADTRADFTVAWEPLPGAKLRVEGSAAAGAGGRGPSARAYVSLPLFRIEDEAALGRLVPSLKELLLSGSLALDGYVRLSSDGSLVPNMALTVLDGTLKSKAWEVDAEGVYATVRINSFAPALTPRQELQVALVRRVRMGKLDVSDGFIAFRLEPKEGDRGPTGWTAYVQRGEWGWVGGRLYIEDFRYDPAAKEHTVIVNARDLKLGALLALIPNQEASGVGSLDGQLPVTIGKWPDLRFGNGELRTVPGQSGWFKIRKTEVLGTVLESTDSRFSTDSLYLEIKDRLVGAFKDFEYDELSVVFIREGPRFVARVNTKGRARTGVRQEFGGVTLNFPDFDKTLRDVILVTRGLFGK